MAIAGETRTLHPIVARLRPNDEQLPAVTARGCNVVVTAGAGTGKTRTLVARYLSLLAEGVPLRAIVAITFTRKAAQEMRNRIREELHRYLRDADLAPAERRLWDERYALLDAARIGTIHNLCGEILRAHPAEAGVDPRFQVLEEGQAGILQARAVETALAWAADDPAAVRLYALLGTGTLRETIEQSLRRRLESRELLAGAAAERWASWSAVLVPALAAFVDDPQVRACFAELLPLAADGTLDRAAARGDRLAAPLGRLLELWREIAAARAREDWETISARLRPLRDNMKQVGAGANWQPANPKATIKELQGLFDGRLGWLPGGGINLALDRQLADAAPLLGRAFEQARFAYDQSKRAQQALDFDDLEELALGLLRDRADVRARWQAEIAAILVDEYQDTNGRQRDLVRLLDGGDREQFIVGDAKQSIYRFRGAEVAVFRGERTLIEAEGGLACSLRRSYRAHEALIGGLNALLRPVLGDADDPQRPWREPFSPLEHERETPAAGLAAPFIELHLAVGPKSEGALECAARSLAGYLIDLVESEGSALTYADVAILCRASSSFAAYEDALDAAGIPYLTVAGRGFYERPEVRDLLNILRALADPSDDLALFGLLHSPVFGLTDGELFDLGAAWGACRPRPSLWRFVQGGDRPRLQPAIELVARLHRRAGRAPVANLLKAFLDETDYRAALLLAGQGRAVRNVAKLLADAHTSGLVGVGDFLEYVANLRAGAAREGEARASAEGAVQLMSVHAAKGLQFPIVVIGDAGYQRNSRAGLLFDPEMGLLLPLKDEAGCLPGMYCLRRGLAEDQEAAETDRLLYVAATRAQEKVLLSGLIGLTDDGRPTRLAGWLKQLGAVLSLPEQQIAYQKEGGRALPLALQAGDTPVGGAIYEPRRPAARRRPAAARAAPEPVTWQPGLLAPVPAAGQRLDERASEREREPRQGLWWVLPPDEGWEAPRYLGGRLVHEALARWRFDGPELAAWLEARARHLGLIEPSDLEAAGRHAAAMLARFRRHALWAAADGAEQRHHEVPYTLLDDDGLVESGIVDLLYRRDGRWTLIDFKTDRLTNAAAADAHAARRGYWQQLARYAAAAERLLGERPRAVLCLLDVGGEILVREPEGAAER